MNRSLSKELLTHLLYRTLPEWTFALRRWMRNQVEWNSIRFNLLEDSLCEIITHDLRSARNHFHRSDRAAEPRKVMEAIISSGYHQYHQETLRPLDRLYGFKMRYPLLDRRLLETCLSCPAELFFRKGWKRNLLRSSMRTVVPERLRKRRNWTPFAAPFTVQVKRNKRFIDQVLHDCNSSTGWDYLNRPVTLKLYETILAGSADAPHLNLLANQLYLCVSFICFGVWLKEKRTPSKEVQSGETSLSW